MDTKLSYLSCGSKLVELELPEGTLLEPQQPQQRRRRPMTPPQLWMLKVTMTDKTVMFLSPRTEGGRTICSLTRELVAPQILEVIENGATEYLRQHRHPAYTEDARVVMGLGGFPIRSLAQRAPLRGTFQVKIRQPGAELPPVAQALASLRSFSIKRIDVIETDKADAEAREWRHWSQRSW